LDEMEKEVHGENRGGGGGLERCLFLPFASCFGIWDPYLKKKKKKKNNQKRRIVHLSAGFPGGGPTKRKLLKVQTG